MIGALIFFDIDENSRKDTALPHMLVDQMSWDKIVSNMGIKKNDETCDHFLTNCLCTYMGSVYWVKNK